MADSRRPPNAASVALIDRDRVLLKPTHTCAVYCRFCFRREMVGPEGLSNLTVAQLDAAFAYIAERPEIWEVIVTGGDPFVLSPRRLADISARLAAIEHVKVVRYHTRVPVVDPGAVSDELRQSVVGAVSTIRVPTATTNPSNAAEVTAALNKRVWAAILMVAVSPDFLVTK